MDPLIGAVVDGRWKVLERIGAGAFGAVYKAERIRLGKFVALKFLDERAAKSKEAAARFDREARAISRVHHAHCVSILDFGVHQGRPYIAMEFVPGTSLAKVIATPEMTPVRAVGIMRQVLEALQHAHAHGVVHRDLKPDNIMLAEVTGKDDFVKILDFGLARIISLDEKSITNPATVAGTPGYMSPEQAQGKKVDQRTDVYAAGVMLFAMCVGKRPFEHDDPLQVLRMHIREPPPSPRKLVPDKKLSGALEAVILRALEKDPDRRFVYASEMQRALDATPEARSQRHGATTRSFARVLRWVAALALIGLGAVGALVIPSYFKSLAAAAPDMAKPIDLAQPPVDLAQPPVDLAQPPVDLARSPDLCQPVQKIAAPQDHSEARMHLQQGNDYARKLWRKNALEEWQLALEMDPSLRGDLELGRSLCAALGPKWEGGAARLLARYFGISGVRGWDDCVARLGTK